MMSAAESSISGPRISRWCAGGMVVLAIATVLLPLLMPALAADFEEGSALNWERRGRLFATVGASFVVALVTSGPLADRTHPRPFVLAGHWLIATGLILLGLTRTFAFTMVACSSLGLGAGLLDMVLSPLVARAAGPSRAAALNRLHAAYSVGAVAVTAIGSAWLRAQVSWRWLPVTFALVPLGVSTGFAVLPLPALCDSLHRSDRVPVVLQHREFWYWALIFFGAGAAMAGVSQWLPALARGEAGWSTASAGGALTMFLMGMGISRLAIAPSLHLHPPERVLCVGVVLTIALALIARFIQPPSLAVVALVASGLSCGILWPTALAAASTRIGSGSGSLFGWLSAAGNTGCFVVPWLIGITADRIGLHAALPIAVLPAAIALWILVQWLDGPDRVASKDWTASHSGLHRSDSIVD